MTSRLLSTLVFSVTLAGTGCHKSDYPLFPDGYREFAYVANSGSNTVTVLDLVYLRVDRTLRVGEVPLAVVPNPKRAEAYVLNRESSGANGSISVIDTDSNQVVASVAVQRTPTSLSVDPSGLRAFAVNSGSNSLSVLDLAGRKSIATFNIAAGPSVAVVAPDGRTLLVTHPGAGAISLYAIGSPATSQAMLQIRSSFSGCPGATSPVILPDSSKAFVACPGSGHVLALSLAAAPNTWAAKQDASLTQDHLLSFLDVGHNPTNLTLKPDGGEVFVSNADSGSVSEISTQTNEVGSTFGIGDRPSHGIVSADNSVLWVSNYGADSVSLYSIDDGKRLPSLRVGASPDALAFTTGKDQHFLLIADRLSGDVAVIRNSTTQASRLLTMLPVGPNPAAIAVQSNAPRR